MWPKRYKLQPLFYFGFKNLGSNKPNFPFSVIVFNIYEVCSKSIRPFSLSPIRYEQTARAKCGCTHTHSRVIVKRFRPICHSYLSV